MAQAQAADSGSSSSNSFCFYQDPSEHEAQKALRRAWVVQQSSTHLTAAAANKGARRPKQHLQQQQLPETPCGVNEVPGSAVAASVPRGAAAAESSSAPRKRKALVSTQDVTGKFSLIITSTIYKNLIDLLIYGFLFCFSDSADKDKDKDTRSPISSRQQRPAVPSSAKRSYSNGGPGGDGVADGGGSGSGSKFITPAAVQASGSKHNRISPGDYADRLASQCHSHSNGGSSADLLAASGGISNVSPTMSPRPRSSLQVSNSYGYGRGSRQAVPGNSSSSFSSASASATVARLRALRDDDEDGEPATACAEQGQRQEQVQEEQFTAAIVARQSKVFIECAKYLSLLTLIYEFDRIIAYKHRN